MPKLTRSTLKYMGAKADFSELSINTLTNVVKKFIKDTDADLGNLDANAFEEYLQKEYPFQEQSDLFEIDDQINSKLYEDYLSMLQGIFRDFSAQFKAFVNEIDHENSILYKNTMARWRQANQGGG